MNNGELGEWLNQQFAKLSLRKWRISSNLILSAKHVGVTRKAREVIANHFDAGSIPVTYSRNKSTVVVLQHTLKK